MNEGVIQQLKKLKSIRPQPQFMMRSRMAILATLPKKTIFWPTQVVRFSFAAALAILIITLAFLPQKTSPSVSNSFNANKLREEFNNLSINISLEEITYRQAVNQAIASALNEVSGNSPKNLDKWVLESEQKNIEVLDQPASEIDKLLEQITF